ncbi:hypothetical protein CWI42_010590 [Ordospora colligata]|uniref:Uncharacterized protein n=1 Tax=Ordospora colligata OC4 TaxID=1354746 RepID=A0A0B2UMW6_9MICR|nr:uncharacterized protein M896_010590 [Ordospora colligata OC4]KHN70407.1 hypothetical protein M896_010590 [Ordospora colligata OC4]TBU17157.1 hypothetical protein CWI41_010590 [Ordospora colligata]TBU17407.1 hypothetical protein CWI40_010590 [Ordospora colligata]TBU19587.1 hypothetical protein CWI42_010590 [Ordospora colligata]
MDKLKNTLKEAKVHHAEQSVFPCLEVCRASEVPRILPINTLDNLNEVLREFEFPIIEQRMLDDHLALIDVLNNLNIEYGRYGLQFSAEMDSLRSKQEELALVAECERECDVLEVELANIKQKYDEVEELSHYNIEDLKHRLCELRKLFNDSEYEKQHGDLIEKTLGFMRLENNCDESIAGALRYIKESKTYTSCIERMIAENTIRSAKDSLNKHIFTKLISQEHVQLCDLEHALKIDRQGLLRIVYGLLSKGIIIFDRAKDRISIQR